MDQSPKPITSNEKKVLYGLVRYSNLNDKQLAKVLGVKDSTLTSVKKRLSENKYYRTLFVPMLNRLGCELLGISFTSFNPIIPLDKRIKKSTETIEKNDEIFLSVGALEHGFSLSFTKDYTTYSKINENRTIFFGKEHLIDKDYPREVIFPFTISRFHRFFDYSHVLAKLFNFDKKSINQSELDKIIKGLETELKEDESPNNRDNINTLKEDNYKNIFEESKLIKLSEKERLVFCALIKQPEATMQQIGDEVGLSRHTVARMKKKFFADGLIKKIIIPNLHKLGFSILVFYHFQFSPTHPLDLKGLRLLNSPSAVFFASRQYQAVMLASYPNYADYKDDKMTMIKYLKENKYINYTPNPIKYVYDQMKFIKYFDLAPITKKILESKDR
ncbi:MAG: helix-turn-helix domain-containing protein [Promethearchaeota archaeon]